MRTCDATTSIAILVESGLSLALRCNRCQHRSLIVSQSLASFAGRFQRVCCLPLLCACGSRNVVLHLLEAHAEANVLATSSEPGATTLASNTARRMVAERPGPRWLLKTARLHTSSWQSSAGKPYARPRSTL